MGIPMDKKSAWELIKTQFPDFEIEDIEFLEGGWDNTVAVVNGSTVFRFPLKDEFIPSMKREIGILSLLDEFPVGIPRYQYVPSGEPFFAGYNFIGGVPLNSIPEITPGIEDDLVSILNHMQGIDVSSLSSSGIPVYGVDSWTRRYQTLLESFRESLSGHLSEQVFQEALNLVDTIFSRIPESSFTLVHSDMYRGNVLVSPDYAGINAVIDWQEASIGDHAIDIAAAGLDFGTEFTKNLTFKCNSNSDDGLFSRVRLYQKLEPFHIAEHYFETGNNRNAEIICKKIEQSFAEERGK